MKKLGLVVLVIAAMAALPFLIEAIAQAPTVAWPYFADVTPSGGGAPGTYDLVVPLQIMDKSREDLADLRLFDGSGMEIPYALRVRKEVDDKREITTRLFNQASVGSTSSEVSVDLGENAGDHNEVEIETTGTNFRRRIDLEGSDTGQEWRTLVTGNVIFSFESQNKIVESSRVSYPTSRYRYLRVKVIADELTDRQAPQITGVKVLMAVREKGELTTWNVDVARFDSVRNQGAPASAWNIDLGFRVPCDRLTIEIDDQSFSRPFQVEAVDDPQNVRLVASGELTRRIGEASRPLVIYFDKEEQVRKLRLVMSDFSNQPLSIGSIQPGAAARQLVFDLKEPATKPLRLFFGNLKATAPHYDFEKELSSKLTTAPVRSEVGAVAQNPEYVAEPLPLTERVPWLIYVVLAVSSLALAIVLISLARTTLRKGQQTEETKVEANLG